MYAMENPFSLTLEHLFYIMLIKLGSVLPGGSRKGRMTAHLLSCGEVAELLNVSRSYVYLLMSSGDLPCVRFRHTLRIRPSDLDQYIQAHSGRLRRLPSRRSSKFHKPKA
jgi:excisionase family DNA binding protein